MRISPFSWLFIILLTIIFFEINVVCVSSYCQSDQQGLLLRLKNKLNFNSFSSLKLVKWNETLDCCMWEGVTCDVRGHVIDLDLSNEGIFNGIDDSSSLFNLQHLQSLNLAYNGFKSTFPLGFDKLAKLRHLNLSHAGFIGQIPLEISKMTSLVALDLSVDAYFNLGLHLDNPNLIMLVHNLKELKHLNLDGVNISTQGKEWCQALSSLPNLQVLSMSNCYLSGPIDSSLSQLQSLSVLHLDGNNLSGQFPEEIFQVCTLKTLDLSNNPLLEGFLKEFPPASSLETLLLSDTSFGGTLPESIGNLERLSWIKLKGCSFNGSIPEAMANLTQLVFLDFSWNYFSGPIPSFSLAKNLTHLNIANNHLTGSILSTDWSSLPNLLSIDLSNNLLNGTLPTSFFGNPSLQRIALSQNQFSSRLNDPSNLASSALSSLELGSNRLVGPIPMFVFGLQSLQILILSSNNFSGPLNISSFFNLKDLSTLDLSFNSLSINATVSNPSPFPHIDTLKLASCKLTRFPNFLNEQSKLSYLDLSYNQIDGEIPNWVWNTTSLFYLNLSHNSLVSLQEPMQAFSPLMTLDLSGNKLQGQLLKLLVLSHSASYIDYSSNNFNSVIPINIGDYLESIRFISLSNNSLYGTIPESIYKPKSLTVFDLSNNYLNGTIPELICRPIFLRVLDLSNNSLNGTIPKSICELHSLHILDLSNNYLNGTIPQCSTSMMGFLSVLDLSRNNLNGNIPDMFSSGCMIQTLGLNGNHLEGKIPRSLANCTLLEVLDVGNNQINDTFPCYLKNISSLQVLVLRSNNFHGLIGCLDYNTSLPMLHIIDLASNHFMGELPYHWLRTWEAMIVVSKELKFLVFEVLYYYQEVYYQDAITLTNKGVERRFTKILSLFTSIDFSCNKFEGRIPEVLGEFKALMALNLSHNSFTGLIPSSLVNLQICESLDLSSNNLSGEIPQQLADLTFLAILNLSHNQLEGRIPSGRQFQTFSEDSFKDNKGLCGMPLKENCSANVVPTSEDKHSDDGTHINWNFLSAELGFVFGFGILILPLMFWKRWRVWYYKHVNDLLSKFFPQLNQRPRNHGKGTARRTKT